MEIEHIIIFVKKFQLVGGKPVGYLQSVALDLKKKRATVKQIQVVRAGLKPGASGLRVWRLNHLASPPPYNKNHISYKTL